jgi:NAD:arginine ADP-ribosyltransferase
MFDAGRSGRIESRAHRVSHSVGRVFTEGEGRDWLQPRVSKCIETIRKTAQKKYETSNCFTEFDGQVQEANRITALAQQDLRSAKSKADPMLSKVSEAKRLAAKNPSGPEASMMAALTTENPDLTKEQNEENGKKKFEEFLKKAYEQVAVSGANISMLSPGDVVALHNYTTNDYSSMNLRLIKGFKDTETDKQYKKKIDATVQALKKLPSYEGGMTMRGEWFWPDDAHKAVYYSGNTFAIKPLWSTGVSMCFDFTDIQISVFGKTGKNIESISDKPKETEVLFPPGTKFKVTAYREEVAAKGIIKVFMTVEEV